MGWLVRGVVMFLGALVRSKPQNAAGDPCRRKFVQDPTEHERELEETVARIRDGGTRVPGWMEAVACERQQSRARKETPPSIVEASRGGFEHWDTSGSPRRVCAGGQRESSGVQARAYSRRALPWGSGGCGRRVGPWSTEQLLHKWIARRPQCDPRKSAMRSWVKLSSRATLDVDSAHSFALSVESTSVNLRVHFTLAQCISASLHLTTPMHLRWLRCPAKQFHLSRGEETLSWLRREFRGRQRKRSVPASGHKHRQSRGSGEAKAGLHIQSSS